jgi:hypothetical protein
MYTPSVRIIMRCEDCGRDLINEDGVSPHSAYIVPECTCQDGTADAEEQDWQQERTTASGNTPSEQMRRAADFVHQHQATLRHALRGHAETLSEVATTLREVAESGGVALMTAQVAAETAARKEAEARSLRVTLAALEEITLLS